MSCGQIRSQASVRSLINPASYSSVVRPAVEPETKMVAVPLSRPDCSMCRTTCFVMSMISVCPLVWSENLLLTTAMALRSPFFGKAWIVELDPTRVHFQDQKSGVDPVVCKSLAHGPSDFLLAGTGQSQHGRAGTAYPPSP